MYQKQTYRLLICIITICLANSAAFAEKIHESARIGDANAIYQELLRGIDVDHRDSAGATALHIAAQHGQTTALEYLLLAKADVNATTHRGYTALMAAAGNEYIACLDVLIKAGANLEIRCETGGTALSVAAWAGKSQALLGLLEAGSSVTVADKRGYTPLMLSAMSNVACVQALINHGVDIREKTANGDTALTIAAWAGNVAAIKVLAATGFDLNEINADGETYLTQAARSGATSTARPPVSQRISRFAPAGNEYIACLDVLIKAGANLEIRCETGGTALSVAAWAGKSQALLGLLEAGSSVTVADKPIRTNMIFNKTFKTNKRPARNTSTLSNFDIFIRTQLGLIF